ncbi:TRAP-type C4-dicarboxylate transport system permease small subunit [Roseibium hamelinense]|uniref:TRAP transporter small permease protein n=1 Tax=Roseibium hamelinense TaxID=150831 RepID=A0A562TA41_9HYPH|nr:TRAP transporter small permease [Roseibium hamelinense]MTI43497.1 TRAP transporter small permease [Roseibium hamelinense]TWI89710.1 TRAP-type C4-dicarboxylate transport system permease small subunit [Roseibium hamelinense]
MVAALHRAVTFWALLGGVLAIAIVLVTAVNVGAFMLDSALKPFGIYVSALPGYEDFVRLAVSAAALSFFPYCQMKRGHVAVELFVQSFPEWLRGALDRFWTFLSAALAVFLAYWMWIGMLESRSDGTVTAILGWSEWPWYFPGIVSMGLWALVSLYQAAGGKSYG